MKTFAEYEVEVQRTAASSKDQDTQLMVLALGLTGEAGEVADLVKKHVGHEHPLDLEKTVKELGDCFWYLTALAAHVGVSLETVAACNAEKLRARYPDGFDKWRSINRTDK